MISIEGTLTIRVINGRNGQFSVGTLVTEIGEFAVKDAELDQYEPGKYNGRFRIGRIYPTHYMAGSRINVEIRARLEDIELYGVDPLLPGDSAPASEDPIDTDTPTQPVEVPVQPDVPTDSTDPDASDTPVQGKAEDVQTESTEPASPEDEIRTLFGSNYPLAAEVKLDPTIGRVQFRAQRDKLKAMGYAFDPNSQTWILS